MRLGEVEQEGRAAVGGEADAAAVTVVMGQGHGVEGLAFAGDRGRAQWRAFGGHAGSALPSVPRARKRRALMASSWSEPWPDGSDPREAGDERRWNRMRNEVDTGI